MSISGSATPSGTQRYAERFSDLSAANHFNHQQSLLISSIGIGTYLGNPDDATDALYTEAVTRAVELGCNLIDSAANYRYQRSERAIGKALEKLVQAGVFSRDELVICTKGGYLPFDGERPRDVRAYIEETFVSTGIASFDDFVGGAHCMTPAYLQNQLDQSLRNLGVDSIDVYYIHNPESQLGFVSQAEFYNRAKAAFEMLEQNRTQGKIKWYGVATWNGFRAESDSDHHHSLVQLIELAREVGGESHGLRFIQLPFNLSMPEALTVANETVAGEVMNILEAAKELGVTVVTSASILQGKLASNLPEELRGIFGSLSNDAQRAIQFARSTPGVTSALIGMSKVSHVEENLQVARVAPLSSEEFSALFS